MPRCIVGPQDWEKPGEPELNNSRTCRACLAAGLILAGCTQVLHAESLIQANPAVGLAPLRSFQAETEAAGRCQPDIIVWANRDTGYYHPKGTPEFGRSASGAFTCRIEAAQANYWDTNPFSVLQGRGRAFPINPDLLFKGS